MMVISLNYSFRSVNKVRNNVKVIKFHNRNGYNPGHRCDLIYVRARVNEFIVNICTTKLRLQRSIGN